MVVSTIFLQGGWVWIQAGAFLCGVGMLSLCLQVFCVFLKIHSPLFTARVFIYLWNMLFDFVFSLPLLLYHRCSPLFYVFAFTLNWSWQIKSSPSLVLLDAKYLPIVIFPQLDPLPHSKTNPKAAFVVKLKKKKKKTQTEKPDKMNTTWSHKQLHKSKKTNCTHLK